MKSTSKIQMIIALTLAILILTTCPAFAADSDVPETEIHAVTFTNARTETKGLVITKEVVSMSELYTAPEDAEFTMNLSVNGRFADNSPYMLLNKAGKEIKYYYDIASGEYHDALEADAATESTWYEMVRKTDSAGDFTMKAGQTVIFTGLNVLDEYEVTEVDMPTGFSQMLPANNGAITGTLPEDGATGTFRNRYYQSTETPDDDDPDDDTPGGGGGGWVERKSLNITKTVTAPTGYTLNFDQTFEFEVTVGGEAWKSKPYLIYDSRTNTLVDSTATTTEEGVVVIAGNQTAVLENIPEYSNYVVTERPVDGWWAVGETSSSGNIGNNDAYVTFENGCVSFGIKKSMSDGTVTEDNFTFLITDSTGGVMSNVNYILCDENGTPIDSEIRTTDVFGQLQLQAGQTALLTGITPGTGYNVKELAQAGYKQTIPTNDSGYEHQSVKDKTPDVHPFSNEQVDIEAQLFVIKNVVSEYGSPPNDEFTFLITDKRDAPLSNMHYVIGDTPYLTSPEGYFTLKDGETAVFDRLAVGRNYSIEELGVKTEESFSMDDYTSKEPSKQTVYLTNDGATITYTNNYESFTDLKLLKLDANDLDMPLEGAVFKLEKLLYDNTVDQNFEVKTVTTDEQGEAVFEGLWTGKYMLTELEAPVDFQALKKPIIITINIGENTITRSDNNVSISLDEALVVINSRGGYVLPQTGGPGIAIFYILGSLVVIGAGSLLVKKKKTAAQ